MSNIIKHDGFAVTMTSLDLVEFINEHRRDDAGEVDVHAWEEADCLGGEADCHPDEPVGQDHGGA